MNKIWREVFLKKEKENTEKFYHFNSYWQNSLSKTCIHFYLIGCTKIKEKCAKKICWVRKIRKSVRKLAFSSVYTTQIRCHLLTRKKKHWKVYFEWRQAKNDPAFGRNNSKKNVSYKKLPKYLVIDGEMILSD